MVGTPITFWKDECFRSGHWWMTMFFWARHQIITPCIYWQRGNRGLTLWGRRWLDAAEIAHVAWCRSIKDVLYNKWRICSSNHQRAERFQLFSSRHFVPAFRKNERARHRPRNYYYYYIFFFFFFFLFVRAGITTTSIYFFLPIYPF